LDPEDDRNEDRGDRGARGDDDGGPERPVPFTLFAAAGWTLLARFATELTMVLLVSIRPSAARDQVSLFGCQAIAFLLVIFAMLRVHAPQASVRDFLGLRATNLLFFPLAAGAAFALDPVISALYALLCRRFPPPPDALADMYAEAGRVERVALFAVLVIFGPLLEELLFRGALFQTVKRAAPRYVILAVGIYFGAVHFLWQLWLPIALMGVVMTAIRYMSGSVWPSFVFHAVFNGLAFRQLMRGAIDDANQPIPWAQVLAGFVGTIALLGLCQALSNVSQVARVGRAKDLA
jgi:hypothetical protein